MDSIFFKQFKIFVASPGDVEKERNIVDTIVGQINETIGDTLRINLKVVKWEQLPPETTLESIQERLNQKIKDCHFFLLILNKRYGQIEDGYTVSNTEREINTIIEHLKNNKEKKILSYFKELKQNDDPGMQEQKIIELKKRLSDNNWLYAPYKSLQDFERRLTHDLYKIILRINFSPFKIEQLKKFWRVGKVDGQPVPKISIIYPPVPKTRMTNGLVTNIWQTRLLPHIFYEDYKALHKILKNLSMAGYQDYRVYSKYDIPSEIETHNIIWICLPRLKRGLDELQNHKNRRFDIVSPKQSDTAEAFIKWKSETGDMIMVKSPLRKYLEKQRQGVKPDADWDISLNNIVVKDYAVIARFDRNYVQYNSGIDRLKEFYIAGIHGLGTWGAAWFIDRRFGAFKDLKLEEDIQMLVEVEYKNGRIVGVVDVSEKDQKYFDKENNMNVIKNYIKHFKEK